PIASGSRPTRRIWRPENFAASATSRLTWLKSPRYSRSPAASRWNKFRVKPPRISSACFLKCHLQKRWHDADPDNSRLRILGRRSASRAWLGRVRSQQSEKPPPPLLVARRTDRGSRRDADRDRHLARSARAVDRRRRRSHRRGFPD